MNQNFIDSTFSLRGKAKGQKWLDELPETIKTFENKWGLKSMGTFPNLNINFIERVQTKHGEELVLKIGFPGDEEFLKEVRALEIYNGNGSVRLIKADLENYVMLLEGCIPGKSLHTMDDENKEALIFTNICKRVWTKAPSNSIFKNVSDLIKEFDWYFENSKKTEKLLPKELVTKAQEKFKTLVSSTKDQFLLHGDLHHDNILSSDRGWLAIDPKGIIGDREYEIAAFIRNPYFRFEKNEELISKDFFAVRIEFISTTLRFDKKRITDWAFVKQVITLIWTIQDHNKSDKLNLEIAKALEELV